MILVKHTYIPVFHETYFKLQHYIYTAELINVFRFLKYMTFACTDADVDTDADGLNSKLNHYNQNGYNDSNHYYNYDHKYCNNYYYC